MKKIGLGMLTSCLLVLSLTACSQGNSNTRTDSSMNESQEPSAAEDTSSSSGGKKTIVYNVKDMNVILEEEKKKYEALHPNIEIKFETMNREEYEKLDSDGRRKMMDDFQTTKDVELMAGKGPDIMQFNNELPQKYLNHNFLVDLGTMMEQDSTFKKEDYFSNILDNSRDSKGRLYAMPLGFGLSGYFGNAEAIDKTGVKFDDNTWTWTDFLNIAKQFAAANGTYKSAIYSHPVNVMREVLLSNPSIVLDSATKTAHFDSPQFKDLMNQLKAMKDEGIMTAKVKESYFANLFIINSPWDYLRLANIYYKNGRFYTQPHPEGEKGGYFEIASMLSINANSKVKEEAWEFVKFMMEDEAVHASIIFGIPINKEGLANQIDRLKSQGTVAAKDGSQSGQNSEVNEAKIEEFKRRVNEAVLQKKTDAFLGRSMEADMEFQAFMSGQKSLDAVAKVLQDKATTYLNE